MPYVRVAIDTFKPGTGDTVLENVKQGLVPLLQRQPGFISYEVVRTAPDAAIFIHTCEAREQLDAAAVTVADWVRANVAASVANVTTHVGHLAYSSLEGLYPAADMEHLPEIEMHVEHLTDEKLAKRIQRLEQKYNMSSEEFLRKYDNGQLDDTDDFFDWEWLLLEATEAGHYPASRADS